MSSSIDKARLILSQIHETDEHLGRGFRGFGFIEWSEYGVRYNDVSDSWSIYGATVDFQRVLHYAKDVSWRKETEDLNGSKPVDSEEEVLYYSQGDDMVVSPPHYGQGATETIDAIKSCIVGYKGEEAFYAGNVIKYIARAPFKGSKIEDLEKAQWYLTRAIDESRKASKT